jgi:hypothetical protein
MCLAIPHRTLHESTRSIILRQSLYQNPDNGLVWYLHAFVAHTGIHTDTLVYFDIFSITLLGPGSMGSCDTISIIAQGASARPMSYKWTCINYEYLSKVLESTTSERLDLMVSIVASLYESLQCYICKTEYACADWLTLEKCLLAPDGNTRRSGTAIHELGWLNCPKMYFCISIRARAYVHSHMYIHSHMQADDLLLFDTVYIISATATNFLGGVSNTAIHNVVKRRIPPPIISIMIPAGPMYSQDTLVIQGSAIFSDCVLSKSALALKWAISNSSAFHDGSLVPGLNATTGKLMVPAGSLHPGMTYYVRLQATLPGAGQSSEVRTLVIEQSPLVAKIEGGDFRMAYFNQPLALYAGDCPLENSLVSCPSSFFSNCFAEGLCARACDTCARARRRLVRP